jgi:hypothetical protein
MIVVILSALYLTACSGNNDVRDIDSVEEVDSAIGIWFGEATTIDSEQESVVVAVSSEGKAIMFAEKSSNVLIANEVVGTNVITSEDTMYYPKDNMTRYGSMQASATSDMLEGTATVSGSVIEFSATTVTSQDIITLTDVAGNYSDSSSDNTFTRSFAIDNEGVISGSDTAGCIYSGNVEPIADVNTLLNITVEVDTCFEDFTYEGLLAYGTFPFDYEGAINDRKGIVIVAEHASRAYAIRLFSPQN